MTGMLTRPRVAIAAALAALVPAAAATAAGPIWLPTVQAAHLPAQNVALALATYRNHAYILSTRVDSAGGVRGVYFTTDESGAWTTRLLASQGPAELVQDYRTSLAIDPTTRRLYAAWVHAGTPGHEALGVWTRDAAGTWSGPTDIATTAAGFDGPPSVVAGGGKAYVAFAAPDDAKPPCDDHALDRSDVLISSYSGTSWSAPQNLTSCVHGLAAAGSFTAPKLALDSGHLYLVSANSAGLTWDLWYADDAGGVWSPPARITHKRDNDLYHDDYSIAASGGTAYVAYTAYTGSSGGFSFGNHDIFLAAHPQGGPWVYSDVTKEPYDCDKSAPALVARAGRLGLAYVYADVNAGGCGSSSSGSEASIGVHMLTGTPGHWTQAALDARSNSYHASVAVASDGDIFRLVYSDPRDNAGAYSTDLYYTPEFLDVVGPTTHLAVPATATAPSIRISWSAQDPTPGSGVAYYVVQMRMDSGPWQDLTPTGTRSTFLVYAHLQAGHRYTFRVRARDKVNNWGSWVYAETRAA
jgi:hypothetical protein